DADVAFFDEALQCASGNRRESGAQKIIQPFRSESSFDNENFGAARHAQQSAGRGGGLHRFRLAFTAPRQDENQAHTGADGAVRDIEGGEPVEASVAFEIEIQEVNDMPVYQAINEIADDSSDDETEGDLAQAGAGIEMPPREIKNHQRE